MHQNHSSCCSSGFLYSDLLGCMQSTKIEDNLLGKNDETREERTGH